ncbi:MAG: hypothetical protein ACLTE2_12150 [Eubacteriales bacterium]
MSMLDISQESSNTPPCFFLYARFVWNQLTLRQHTGQLINHLTEEKISGRYWRKHFSVPTVTLAPDAERHAALENTSEFRDTENGYCVWQHHIRLFE